MRHFNGTLENKLTFQKNRDFEIFHKKSGESEVLKTKVGENLT